MSPRIIALVTHLVLLQYGLKADLKMKHSNHLSAPLTNFLLYKGRLYVGGANEIYALNENLDIIQTASTCGFSSGVCSEYRNINKILLAHQSKKGDVLILCGTENFKLCEIRNLSNIDIVIGKSSDLVKADYYLKVSSNEHRPAVGMVTQNGQFTIAVTFGEGIQSIEQNVGIMTYRYAISTRNLYNFHPVGIWYETKVLHFQIENLSLEDYIVYYKACFQHNWISYFVTNQKSEVGSSNYVSKLVRICQNDTGYNSYADIVLNCRKNGITFNLIQGAILFDSGPYTNNSDKLFIGAFTRGNDPEHPSGDSVICVTKLNILEDAILEARREYATSSCKRSEDKNKRYLPAKRQNVKCITDKKDLELFDFECNTHEIYSNVVIKKPVSMASRFHLKAESGVITTLRGTIYENKLVVLLGTSTGNIIQTVMLQHFSMVETSKEAVDAGYSIRKIFTEGDKTVYVMSSNRVMKYPTTNCSEFRSCADIVQRKNPLCGWCVYKQRATRRTECSGDSRHWVTPFEECLSMSMEPSVLPVSITPQSSNLSVTIRIKNIPMKHTGDTYHCRFVLHSNIGIFSAVELKNSGFACMLPNVSVHAYVEVELLVRTISGITAILSTKTLLFYDCRRHRRCMECIHTGREVCYWCARTATCQEPNSVCMSQISEEENCPQLRANKGNFLPAGIRTTVTLQLVNARSTLIPKGIYRCLLPETFVSAVAVLNGDTVSCPLQVMDIGNIAKRHFKIVVTYGLRGDQLAEVDDIFQNSVAVYSCPQLASTCSQCHALNKARYSCCWGGTNQCVHSGTHYRSQCPAPNITKIIPSPTKGGTHLSIYGTNLGMSVSEVEDITVAGVPCDLISDTDFYQMQHSLDFETPVPSWLVCITRKTTEEVTGAVNVVVDGQSSESNLEFSYKIPRVTAIYPTFGPKAGGTTVTIYGNNLSVGNKNVSVLFGNQPCQQSKIYPEEETDASNHTVQCTIECILPGACISNITELSFSIDGQEVVRSSRLWYSFVNDPIVNKISPKTAFFSGGTTLTVEGKHLSNVHSSFIKLSYEEEQRVTDCDSVSAVQCLCKVPEVPSDLIEHFANYFPSGRMKTSACGTSIDVTLELNFDAVCQNVTIAYFQDPFIHDLPGDGNIITFDPKEPWVEVTVECLNVVPADSDITITVGTETCIIINLTTTSIVCIAPTTKPQTVKSGVNHPRVKVCSCLKTELFQAHNRL
ncbi:plexin-A4-like [Mercenaria mercenaria]|uniref:plexin-A4-like n=1 Tax=Mercenaria mercenaria TaxID=6596 RepID=UPI00234EFF74|nr:plexin-A4-like [Mercenaria mercenaria]